MHRREFLIRSATGVSAAWLTSKELLAALARQPALGKFSASDTVMLGSTGITTSRLAMGTGTVGYGHHSNQTALGVKGLSDLLLNGYDQGLRFFDAADAYGSHPHVAEALKHVPRDKVGAYENLGARSGYGACRSRPLPPRVRHGLSRHLPDALPDRRGVDRTLPRGDGCFFRGQAEGNYSGPWMFLPQY